MPPLGCFHDNVPLDSNAGFEAPGAPLGEDAGLSAAGLAQCGTDGRRTRSFAPPRTIEYYQIMEMLTSDEIIRLSPPERIALIAQLWDSLNDAQLPITGAQEAELEARLATLDQDRQNGVTWSALKAELEQRCP